MLSAVHFLTHIGQGWILANLWPASRRDRWPIVLGIGILWSHEAYVALHRAAGHGLVAGLLPLAITLMLADAPWRTAARTPPPCAAQRDVGRIDRIDEQHVDVG